jgi:DNA invertase Pin-like site-specific DNA recombinase
MLVGYMRVSSDNDRQTTDLQRDALLEAGVDPRQLFADKASGSRTQGLQIIALPRKRPRSRHRPPFSASVQRKST